MKQAFRILRTGAARLAAVLLVLSLALPAAAGGPPVEKLPTTDGFNLAAYRGKRLVLLFYSIDTPRADLALKIMNELYHSRREYNLEVVGICSNHGKEAAVQQFNRKHKVSFPVFMEKNNRMHRMLRMRGTLGFYIFDRSGRAVARKLAISIPLTIDMERTWRGYAARQLQIPYVPDDQPVLGIKPPVPLFEGLSTDNRTIRIKDVFPKKPVVIVIFSPRCIHCQHELGFLKDLYTAGDLQGRFEVVAVSLLGKSETEKIKKEKELPFALIPDARRVIVSLFPSYLGNIPVSFLVDRQGHINAQHSGFNARLKDIYRMELRKMAGLPNPPLLAKQGYSGEQRCGVCHEKQHIQWSLTSHSDAFVSIIRKGKEDDGRCVSCHVTGFEEPGGYSMKDKIKAVHLQGVQCEACHGPGFQACSAFTGKAPAKKKAAEWKDLCLSCHTQEQSLNFIFSKRFPKAKHDNAPDLTNMDREERLQLLEDFRKKKLPFDSPAKYVGAKFCKKCHPEQYDQWRQTPHARAHKSDRAEAAPPEEAFRYNTGAGRPGGFPEPGLRGVQCEACHGPGQRHLENPEATGQDYIVGLGVECPSCVVEQICRTCHSPDFDPEFSFDEQIEKVRHPEAAPPAAK